MKRVYIAGTMGNSSKSIPKAGEFRVDGILKTTIRVLVHAAEIYVEERPDRGAQYCECAYLRLPKSRDNRLTAQEFIPEPLKTRLLFND